MATEYELYTKKHHIIDKDTFLYNLKQLACDSRQASELYDKLYKMSCTKVDIPRNLSDEQVLENLDTYYFNSMESLFIPGVYHIILSRFNYKLDESANVFNMQPIYKCICRAYREDYEKFVNCMNEWMEYPSKWGKCIKFFPETKVDAVDITEIKVPVLPF